MKYWNKKDIGKVLVYRTLYDQENEQIAIVKTYEETSNVIKAVNYPIALNSRLFILGLPKIQEKKDKNSLKNAGDWYFVKRVSKEERQELERILKSRKEISDVF